MLGRILSSLFPSVFPSKEDVAALDKVRAAGESAVVLAEALWILDITDPSYKAQAAWTKAEQESVACIDNMIRSQKGLFWKWLRPYAGNGMSPPFQWCGAFAATCHHESISDAARATFWASTLRLACWAQYMPWNGTPNPRPGPGKGPGRIHIRLDANSKRLPSGYKPQAGDILLVGDGSPDVGDHICLVRSYDEVTRTFYTYEGNALGVGPKGNHREGVIQGRRPIGARPGQKYHVRRIIRIAPHDLTF